MDIQIQKLNIIQRLIQVNDKNVIQKIDSILAKSSDNITPMTLEEFYARIEEAEDDITNGRVTSHDDFLNEVEKW